MNWNSHVKKTTGKAIIQTSSTYPRKMTFLKIIIVRMPLTGLSMVLQLKSEVSAPTTITQHCKIVQVMLKTNAMSVYKIQS